MAITITDQYNQITVKINTTLQNYNNLYLQTYINNSTTVHSPSYIGTYNDGILTYTIPFSDYEIGDVITNAKLVLNGTTNIYDLKEGVSVAVDGEEIRPFSASNSSTIETTTTTIDGEQITSNVQLDTVKQQYFGLIFEDNNEHTVQAIFKGNKSLGVALSDVIPVTPTQIIDPNPSDNTPVGNYLLTVVKSVKTMTYMADVDFKFKLTKGGEIVSGKTVEVDTPSGVTYSADTVNGIRTVKIDKEGLSSSTLLNHFRRWNVGTHKVIARFYHYDDPNTTGTVLTSCKFDLKITKGTPTMTFTGAGTKGNKAKFKLCDPQGYPLANKKVSIKVGGKTYYKTTNDYGNARLTINSKGYKTYTVKYNGDSNLKSKKWTFTETVN